MSKKQSNAAEVATASHSYRQVRRAGVPLSLFTTADPAAMQQACVACLNGRAEVMPLLGWDCVRGIYPLALPGIKNELGKAYVAAMDDNDKANALVPSFAIDYLTRKPPIGERYESEESPSAGAVFFHNLARWWGDQSPGPDIATVQALWNARNVFESIGVTLAILSPSAKLPVELKNDCVVFEETPPTDKEIERIARSVASDGGVEEAKLDLVRAVDGCLGLLSAFNVKQNLALSLRKSGYDNDALWKLKVTALKETAGLEITQPKQTLADLVGCEGFKLEARRILAGKRKPRAILLWDELEKMVAGMAGDLSGTSQAMTEQWLGWMTKLNALGMLLIGVSGAGKTWGTYCLAGEAGIPHLKASMSTVKGGIVGQSEAQMKMLLATAEAIAQGELLVVSTCNDEQSLSPEMMSRHRTAQMFYDLPTAEENRAQFGYYMRKYGLDAKQPLPAARGWVGREIAACCEKAWMYDLPLLAVEDSIVPVNISNAQKVKALRERVSGRFLSAAHPGLFRVETAQEAPAVGRKLEAQ